MGNGTTHYHPHHRQRSCRYGAIEYSGIDASSRGRETRRCSGRTSTRNIAFVLVDSDQLLFFILSQRQYHFFRKYQCHGEIGFNY